MGTEDGGSPDGEDLFAGLENIIAGNELERGTPEPEARQRARTRATTIREAVAAAPEEEKKSVLEQQLAAAGVVEDIDIEDLLEHAQAMSDTPSPAKTPDGTDQDVDIDDLVFNMAGITPDDVTPDTEDLGDLFNMESFNFPDELVAGAAEKTEREAAEEAARTPDPMDTSLDNTEPETPAWKKELQAAIDEVQEGFGIAKEAYEGHEEYDTQLEGVTRAMQEVGNIENHLKDGLFTETDFRKQLDIVNGYRDSSEQHKNYAQSLASPPAWQQELQAAIDEVQEGFSIAEKVYQNRDTSYQETLAEIKEKMEVVRTIANYLNDGKLSEANYQTYLDNVNGHKARSNQLKEHAEGLATPPPAPPAAAQTPPSHPRTQTQGESKRPEVSGIGPRSKSERAPATSTNHSNTAATAAKYSPKGTEKWLKLNPIIKLLNSANSHYSDADISINDDRRKEVDALEKELTAISFKAEDFPDGYLDENFEKALKHVIQAGDAEVDHLVDLKTKETNPERTHDYTDEMLNVRNAQVEYELQLKTLYEKLGRAQEAQKIQEKLNEQYPLAIESLAVELGIRKATIETGKDPSKAKTQETKTLTPEQTKEAKLQAVNDRQFEALMGQYKELSAESYRLQNEMNHIEQLNATLANSNKRMLGEVSTDEVMPQTKKDVLKNQAEIEKNNKKIDGLNRKREAVEKLQNEVKSHAIECGSEEKFEASKKEFMGELEQKGRESLKAFQDSIDILERHGIYDSKDFKAAEKLAQIRTKHDITTEQGRQDAIDNLSVSMIAAGAADYRDSPSSTEIKDMKSALRAAGASASNMDNIVAGKKDEVTYQNTDTHLSNRQAEANVKAIMEEAARGRDEVRVKHGEAKSETNADLENMGLEDLFREAPTPPRERAGSVSTPAVLERTDLEKAKIARSERILGGELKELQDKKARYQEEGKTGKKVDQLDADITSKREQLNLARQGKYEAPHTKQEKKELKNIDRDIKHLKDEIGHIERKNQTAGKLIAGAEERREQLLGEIQELGQEQSRIDQTLPHDEQKAIREKAQQQKDKLSSKRKGFEKVKGFLQGKQKGYEQAVDANNVVLEDREARRNHVLYAASPDDKEYCVYRNGEKKKVEITETVGDTVQDKYPMGDLPALEVAKDKARHFVASIRKKISGEHDVDKLARKEREATPRRDESDRKSRTAEVQDALRGAGQKLSSGLDSAKDAAKSVAKGAKALAPKGKGNELTYEINFDDEELSTPLEPPQPPHLKTDRYVDTIMDQVERDLKEQGEQHAVAKAVKRAKLLGRDDLDLQTVLNATREELKASLREVPAEQLQNLPQIDRGNVDVGTLAVRLSNKIDDGLSIADGNKEKSTTDVTTKAAELARDGFLLSYGINPPEKKVETPKVAPAQEAAKKDQVPLNALENAVKKALTDTDGPIVEPYMKRVTAKKNEVTEMQGGKEITKSLTPADVANKVALNLRNEINSLSPEDQARALPTADTLEAEVKKITEKVAAQLANHDVPMADVAQSSVREYLTEKGCTLREHTALAADKGAGGPAPAQPVPDADQSPARARSGAMSERRSDSTPPAPAPTPKPATPKAPGTPEPTPKAATPAQPTPTPKPTEPQGLSEDQKFLDDIEKEIAGLGAIPKGRRGSVAVEDLADDEREIAETRQKIADREAKIADLAPKLGSKDEQPAPNPGDPGTRSTDQQLDDLLDDLDKLSPKTPTPPAPGDDTPTPAQPTPTPKPTEPQGLSEDQKFLDDIEKEIAGLGAIPKGRRGSVAVEDLADDEREIAETRQKIADREAKIADLAPKLGSKDEQPAPNPGDLGTRSIDQQLDDLLNDLDKLSPKTPTPPAPGDGTPTPEMDHKTRAKELFYRIQDITDEVKSLKADDSKMEPLKRETDEIQREVQGNEGLRGAYSTASQNYAEALQTAILDTQIQTLDSDLKSNDQLASDKATVKNELKAAEDELKALNERKFAGKAEAGDAEKTKEAREKVDRLTEIDKAPLLSTEEIEAKRAELAQKTAEREEKQSKMDADPDLKEAYDRVIAKHEREDAARRQEEEIQAKRDDTPEPAKSTEKKGYVPLEVPKETKPRAKDDLDVYLEEKKTGTSEARAAPKDETDLSHVPRPRAPSIGGGYTQEQKNNMLNDLNKGRANDDFIAIDVRKDDKGNLQITYADPRKPADETRDLVYTVDKKGDLQSVQAGKETDARIPEYENSNRERQSEARIKEGKDVTPEEKKKYNYKVETQENMPKHTEQQNTLANTIIDERKASQLAEDAQKLGQSARDAGAQVGGAASTSVPGKHGGPGVGGRA